MISFNRRRFLVGTGGMLVALPFLEGLAPKAATAADVDQRFFIFMRQWYGVQQKSRFAGGYSDEPEGFWPNIDTGFNGAGTALNKAALEAKDSNNRVRALGELSDFAESMLVLRGIRLVDFRSGLHRPLLAQVLSGSKFGRTRPGFTNPDDDNNAMPIHETLDNLIARKIDGSKPLTFECLYGDSQTSFDNPRNAGDIPIANPVIAQPSSAYNQLFKQALQDSKGAALRSYASDAVLAELKALRQDPRLSAADRSRLDAHFDALNAVETKLRCNPVLTAAQQQILNDSDLPKTSNPSLKRWQRNSDYNEYCESVADAFIQIIALGASCGAFRAANLVMPAGNFDHTSIFTPGSAEYNSGYTAHLHDISHRLMRAGDADGSAKQPAMDAQHQVDHWHARQFAKLLRQLKELDVLDKGICMWSNEISTGGHTAHDMPYILAGSAGGKLKTGMYYDMQTEASAPNEITDSNASYNAVMAKQMPCTKVLNTVGAALGVKSDDNQPLHDFGGYQRDTEARITGNIASLLK